MRPCDQSAERVLGFCLPAPETPFPRLAGAWVGLSLETGGQILGHTQAATTKRYAFLFDDAKREAADLMSARLAHALRRRPALRISARPVQAAVDISSVQ